MQADKKKKDVEALVEKAHLKVRVGDVHMAKTIRIIVIKSLLVLRKIKEKYIQVYMLRIRIVL